MKLTWNPYGERGLIAQGDRGTWRILEGEPLGSLKRKPWELHLLPRFEHGPQRRDGFHSVEEAQEYAQLHERGPAVPADAPAAKPSELIAFMDLAPGVSDGGVRLTGNHALGRLPSDPPAAKPGELIAFLDRQLAHAAERQANPVPHPAFQPPDWWRGYERALRDTRDWARHRD